MEKQTSSQSVLISQVHEQVTVVALNRPEVLNALNRTLLESLQGQIKKIGKSDTRAVIFSGSGNRAFCAGADLKERQGMSLDETRKFVELIASTFDAIEELPMPTIAAIDGVAFGGGLELALACDLRIMHPSAKVGLTECALGIIPGAGGTQRLPAIIGISRAKELIFSAKQVSGIEAIAIGLANHVTSEGESALKIALEWAHIIAKNAPLSVRAAKKAIDGLESEHDCYESIVHTEDRKEALNAFAEKRRPVFRGR